MESILKRLNVQKPATATVQQKTEPKPVLNETKREDSKKQEEVKECINDLSQLSSILTDLKSQFTENQQLLTKLVPQVDGVKETKTELETPPPLPVEQNLTKEEVAALIKVPLRFIRNWGEILPLRTNRHDIEIESRITSRNTFGQTQPHIPLEDFKVILNHCISSSLGVHSNTKLNPLLTEIPTSCKENCPNWKRVVNNFAVLPDGREVRITENPSGKQTDVIVKTQIQKFQFTLPERSLDVAFSYSIEEKLDPKQLPLLSSIFVRIKQLRVFTLDVARVMLSVVQQGKNSIDCERSKPIYEVEIELINPSQSHACSSLLMQALIVRTLELIGMHRPLSVFLKRD